MTARRYLFYIEGVDKPIIITDNNPQHNLDSIIIDLSTKLKENKFLSFSTDTDTLIANPLKISAITIQEIKSKYSKKLDINGEKENSTEVKIDDTTTDSI